MTPRTQNLCTGSFCRYTNLDVFSYGIIRPINWNYDDYWQGFARCDVHDDGHANPHPREADFALKRNFPDTHIQELPSAALFFLAWFGWRYQITNVNNN